jgi:hypothetical protein
MATGVWKDTVPEPISVIAFLETEIARLEADGVQIAAFPIRTSSGVAVRAAHFGRSLRDAVAAAGQPGSVRRKGTEA